MKRWLNINQGLFNSKILSTFNKLIEKEYILLDYLSHEFNNILFRRIDVQGHNLDI